MSIQTDNKEWRGYINLANGMYHCSNESEKDNPNMLLVAKGDIAYNLYREAVGNNNNDVHKLFPEEINSIRVSKRDLQFIRIMGIEYLERHIPNKFQLRFYLRCLNKLAKILGAYTYCYDSIEDINGKKLNWDE